MYRDELEAAMEQARAMQGKLSDLEQQRDTDEAELSTLREVVARQNAELERLRDLVGEEPPSPGKYAEPQATSPDMAPARYPLQHYWWALILAATLGAVVLTSIYAEQILFLALGVMLLGITLVAIVNVPFGKSKIESRHTVHRDHGGDLLVTLESGETYLAASAVDVVRIRARDAATGKQLAQRSRMTTVEHKILGCARDLIWVQEWVNSYPSQHLKLYALRASTLKLRITGLKLRRTHPELKAGLSKDPDDFKFDPSSGGVWVKTRTGGRFLIEPHTFQVKRV